MGGGGVLLVLAVARTNMQPLCATPPHARHPTDPQPVQQPHHGDPASSGAFVGALFLL